MAPVAKFPCDMAGKPLSRWPPTALMCQRGGGGFFCRRIVFSVRMWAGLDP